MQDKVEGRNAVAELLKTGRAVDKIYVKSGERQGSIIPIIREAKKRGILVVEVSREKLDAMSESKAHQGIIAQVPPIDYFSVEDILEYARSKNESPFLVILDRVSDPHNLGSVIRSANCFGAHGVIIGKHESVPLTASAIKASAGAAEHTRVARVTNISKTIDDLKNAGLWIAAAEASGRESLESAPLDGALAIVVGGEDSGVSRLVLEKCDFVVSIPMRGEVNSLNASVAAALMLYAASLRR
ncbi:MAG: 23S rRNA (guanosine(2251)-2'-O)-methyltransferase RlmB [Clostridia bacterium]|nr:23S rRNA (guanosine(2251)-2'-O)-methyltransferase RlmB [Clostridia bacterium]